MPSQLQDEIKQRKPFANLHEELWLNLSRTAAELSHTMEQQLRPYGLSTTQYNVLRILRGAGAAGLNQAEIGLRLVARVPDVPRILDRMGKAGLVERVRGKADRRVVMSTLTEAGLKLAGELDVPIVKVMSGLFAGMNDEQRERLNELLVAARAAAPQ